MNHHVGARNWSEFGFTGRTASALHLFSKASFQPHLLPFASWRWRMGRVIVLQPGSYRPAMHWICNDPKRAGVVCMCVPTTPGLVHLFLKTPKVWHMIIFQTKSFEFIFFLVKEANATRHALWPHISLIMCNFMFLWISERNVLKEDPAV